MFYIYNNIYIYIYIHVLIVFCQQVPLLFRWFSPLFPRPSYKVSQAAGFFDHWTMATWIVTLSFTSKSLITLYLLKSLDGIQKNVGEALAVIVIFLGQIAAGSSVFNLCAFLLALLVVILVRIYGLAGKVAKPKAVEADKGKLGSSDVKLVGISNNANSP